MFPFFFAPQLDNTLPTPMAMFHAAAEGVGELSLSTIKQGDMANLAARHSDNICSGGGVLNPYASPGYPSSAAYRAECQSFLQRCNPVLYGATSSSSSVTHDCSQYTALAEAVCGLVAAAVALASAGRFTALTDPTRLSLDDPANTWAYSGRLHRPEVQVLLPLLDKTITLKQFWMTPPDFSEGGLVDGHTTVEAHTRFAQLSPEWPKTLSITHGNQA